MKYKEFPNYSLENNSESREVGTHDDRMCVQQLRRIKRLPATSLRNTHFPQIATVIFPSPSSLSFSPSHTFFISAYHLYHYRHCHLCNCHYHHRQYCHDYLILFLFFFLFITNNNTIRPGAAAAATTTTATNFLFFSFLSSILNLLEEFRYFKKKEWKI